MVKLAIFASILLIAVISNCADVKEVVDSGNMDFVHKKDVPGWKAWIKQRYHTAIGLPAKVVGKLNTVKALYDKAYEKFGHMEAFVNEKSASSLKLVSKSILSGDFKAVATHGEEYIVSIIDNGLEHTEKAIGHIKEQSEKYIAKARAAELQHRDDLVLRTEGFMRKFVEDHLKSVGPEGEGCAEKIEKELKFEVETSIEESKNCINQKIDSKVDHLNEFVMSLEHTMANVKRDKEDFLHCMSDGNLKNITQMKIKNIKNVISVAGCLKTVVEVTADTITEMYFVPHRAKSLAQQFMKIPEQTADCLPRVENFQSSAEKLWQSCQWGDDDFDSCPLDTRDDILEKIGSYDVIDDEDNNEMDNNVSGVYQPPKKPIN